MKWIEAKVTIDYPEPDLAADLVATAFFDLDLQGVVIEDPELTAGADLSPDAITGPDTHAVIGYFIGDRRGEWIADRLSAKLSGLKAKMGLVCRVSYRQVDDQNWAEAWKVHFRPHRVGEHLVVKPTWRDYLPEENDIIIELDPGMAFGTGTHPTTALCLAMIEKHLPPKASVLDVGTGSGILMIAAALLGAGWVQGLDKDAVSVKVAAENMIVNQIDPDRWSVRRGNLLDGVHQTYELVVANILTQVILELLVDLPGVLSQNGIFICSGIIRANKRDVIEKLSTVRMAPIEICDQDEWIVIVAKRQ